MQDLPKIAHNFPPSAILPRARFQTKHCQLRPGWPRPAQISPGYFKPLVESLHQLLCSSRKQASNILLATKRPVVTSCFQQRPRRYKMPAGER